MYVSKSQRAGETQLSRAKDNIGADWCLSSRSSSRHVLVFRTRNRGKRPLPSDRCQALYSGLLPSPLKLLQTKALEFTKTLILRGKPSLK